MRACECCSLRFKGLPSAALLEVKLVCGGKWDRLRSKSQRERECVCAETLAALL